MLTEHIVHLSSGDAKRHLDQSIENEVEKLALRHLAKVLRPSAYPAQPVDCTQTRQEEPVSSMANPDLVIQLQDWTGAVSLVTEFVRQHAKTFPYVFVTDHPRADSYLKSEPIEPDAAV